MLYDLENLFSNNQAITADEASTNVLKLASGQLKEVAFGTPIPLRIQVTENQHEIFVSFFVKSEFGKNKVTNEM